MANSGEETFTRIFVFFPHSTKSGSICSAGNVSVFVCQDYLVFSVNQITRLSYLKGLSNIPEAEKDHRSLVSHDLFPFPYGGSLWVDARTDQV